MVVTLVKGARTYMLREEETTGDRTHTKPTVGNDSLRTVSIAGSGYHLHYTPLALSNFNSLFAVLGYDAVHQRIGHVAFDAAVSLLCRE
jgi:hypothetical protein